MKRIDSEVGIEFLKTQGINLVSNIGRHGCWPDFTLVTGYNLDIKVWQAYFAWYSRVDGSIKYRHIADIADGKWGTYESRQNGIPVNASCIAKGSPIYVVFDNKEYCFKWSEFDCT